MFFHKLKKIEYDDHADKNEGEGVDDAGDSDGDADDDDDDWPFLTTKCVFSEKEQHLTSTFLGAPWFSILA